MILRTGFVSVEKTTTMDHMYGDEPAEAPASSRFAVPAHVEADMRGRSWHDDPRCPAFERLRLLRIPYIGFDELPHEGELVVAAEVADEVMRAFELILAARFPLGRMCRIDAYNGDDHESMAANNCSAFNFREISARPELSQHAFGLAIDINPVQNPFVRPTGFVPPNGCDYLDRTDLRPGMIARPGPVTDAFDSIGWSWGGDWVTVKDYHHFSKTGV